jgi:hypothetical protein
VSDVILEAWASGLLEIAKFRSTPKALLRRDTLELDSYSMIPRHSQSRGAGRKYINWVIRKYRNTSCARNTCT